MALLTRVALLGAVALPLLGIGIRAQQPPKPAPAAAATEAGKKLFVQRCSVCHMPPLGPGQPRSYARPLAGFIKNKESEGAARELIQKGLPNRMPGFQYGLTSAEVEQIVVYLSALK